MIRPLATMFVHYKGIPKTVADSGYIIASS